MTSLLNNSITPLAANGEFIGNWEHHKGYGGVSAIIDTDQDGVVKFSFSTNGNVKAHAQTFPITGGNMFHKSVNSKAHYFRVSYTNGGVEQTEFDLKTIYKTHTNEVEFDTFDSLPVVQSGVWSFNLGAVDNAVLDQIETNTSDNASETTLALLNAK